MKQQKKEDEILQKQKHDQQIALAEQKHKYQLEQKIVSAKKLIEPYIIIQK